VKITDYLDPAHVYVDLAAASRRELLEQLIVRLEDHLPPDIVAGQLVERLEAHEVCCASCIDTHIAVPHLLLAGLQGPLLAVARTAAPVPYDESSGATVFLVFLLLSPAEHQAQHIRSLARLTRISRECHFATRARDLERAEELYALIEEEDWRHI
jgi:PTS system nitrogen regulatory IIA component